MSDLTKASIINLLNDASAALALSPYAPTELVQDLDRMVKDLGSSFLEIADVPKPIADALALSARKSQDYNSITGRDIYFPMGLPSYAQMIHTKGMRLINLAQSKGPPNFESVRDTGLDLINYACFMVDACDRGVIK